MSSSDEHRSMPRRLVDGMFRLVDDRIPETWRSRLGMVRGTFVQMPFEQIRRLLLLARHFDSYREIDRAIFYHRYAATLFVAHRLGLFEELVDKARTVEELATVCDVEPAAVHNLLDILEAQQLVEYDGRRWRLVEFSREFFRRDSPVSLSPLFDIGASYAEAFPDLVDGARSGRTAPVLDVFDDDGRIDELLDGVNSYLSQAGRELVARVDWPEIRHLIAGSMGVSFSSLILSEFPQARVTYGCLPHLVERIPRLRTEYGVDGSRVVETHPHGGEPHQDQWGREAFDLVFLTKKMILDPDNDLGDKFAHKALEVLEPGGVAVFWETMREDDGSTPVERAMEGFLDFGVSPTGPLLTRSGFRRRLEKIGYSDVEVVPCLEGATTFVVARAGE